MIHLNACHYELDVKLRIGGPNPPTSPPPLSPHPSTLARRLPIPVIKIANRYISPLVVSLASLTVPLLAVVEGLMLGVVTPPGVLFGVGALLILVGAGTASVVTMLPHTEVGRTACLYQSARRERADGRTWCST